MVPVVGQHDSSTHCGRDFRAIPARWNHFADRRVLGGESRRTRRGLEEVDMSRTIVDAVDLERRVKDMYTQVALDPHGQFHSVTRSW